MSRRLQDGTLLSWPSSSCTTGTSQTSAGPRTRRSRASRAGFATLYALASCRGGGHAIWWTVDAANEAAALGLLPYFVGERTTATEVAEVDIP